MYPSPFMTCMIIAGIICIAVVPPLGVILIMLGIAEQRRLNGRHRRADQASAQRARKQAYDRGVRYFR